MKRKPKQRSLKASSSRKRYAAIGVAWLCLVFEPAHAFAIAANQQGIHHLAIAAGHHDLIDPAPKTGLVLLEYRPCCRWKTLRPAIGSFVDFQGAWYSYAGLRSEIASERRAFLFSVNTAMGYYRRGGGARLGHPLEFRSGFEWYYVMSQEHQIGIAFHHLSNASIGKRNPGTEVLSLVFASAFGQIR